jgi:hypothetical protein
MNLLPAFIRKLFVKPVANFVPETVASAKVEAIKPSMAIERPRNAWVREQLMKYEGSDVRVRIVKIPDHLSLKVGRGDVCSLLQNIYGKGRFGTRLFPTSRTIHIYAK